MIITGASSGIGEATALNLARLGAKLSLGARRIDRLKLLNKKINAPTRTLIESLDVQSSKSISNFFKKTLKKFGHIDILINNAGLARSIDTLEKTSEQDWKEMLQTNVEGVIRMTQAALPHLHKRRKNAPNAHILNLGSIAGHTVYEGGSIYCATKHALKALTQTLRLELLGKPIKVTSIDPGMVETEFSIVRFKGDHNKAKQVYQNLTPLTAQDVAETIVFALTRPSHVNIDQVVLMSTDQVWTKFNRKKSNA